MPAPISDFPSVQRHEWQAAVERDLKGRAFERALVSKTLEGIRLEPLYTEAPAAGAAGLPGAAPHTRGASSLSTSAAGWVIVSQPCQPEPLAAGAEAGEDVADGAGAVWLRLDGAGRWGCDPDQAPQHVGRGGLAVHAAADLEVILALVDLQAVAVELEPGAAFAPAAALLSAVWSARQNDPHTTQGCFGADPLGFLASAGQLPGTLQDSLKSLGQLAEWSENAWPQVATARVDTAPYHEAGCDDATEIAVALATGLTYLRAFDSAGLDLDASLRQLRFTLQLDADLLLGVAKLRAMRRAWSRVTQELGRSQAPRLHVRTARRMLTQRDPWVNALRVSVACAAAAMGGAEAISCAPFDAALGLPGARGRRLARNTQLVLRDESHLHRVIDPWGGAHAVETLSDALTQEAWGVLQEIEAQGGMPAALESGWLRQRVVHSRVARERNVATRRQPITGVSEFPALGEPRSPTPAIDRASLVAAAAVAATSRRSDAPDLGEGQAAAALAASEGATLGQLAELADRSAPARCEPFEGRRLAAPWEALRDASDLHQATTGAHPRVFLACVGRLSEHTARTGWIQNLLAAGGLDSLAQGGCADPAAAAEALARSELPVAVICSSDRLYQETATQLAPALKRAGAQRLLLAGKPGEHEQAWREAGVDGFLHVGVDVLAALRELHQVLGVTA